MTVMDGYVRVSRVGGREGDSYISPSVQREAIERWAEYKGVTIGEWLVDEDQSGGTHDRPALTRGIARALAGETDGIVSWKIDRFSRATEGGLRDLRRLQEAGARLAFVVEDIDTQTVYGRMIYTILLAVSEAFLENVKASWRTAKTRAAGRGAYISRTPFGYAKDESSRLVPDPEEAPIVTEAYRLAASQSLGHATAFLQERAPDHTWTANTTRRLLARQAYLGHIVNGELVERDKHEPLTTAAIWSAAQSSPAPRRAALAYPLSGLLTCDACGEPLTGGRGGKGQRTYRCTRHRGGVVVTADRVEDFVVGVARMTLADMVIQVGAEESPDLADLELELAEAEAELDQFARDVSLRSALGDRYHDYLRERAERVSEMRERHALALRAAGPSFEVSAEDIGVDDPEMLAAALRGLWDRVLVRGGRGQDVMDRVAFVAPQDADRPAWEPSA